MLTADTETEQDRNATIVRRFIDGWVNGGDRGVIDQTWADDMTWHGGSLGTYQGREAVKEFTRADAAGAFVDMHLEIHELIAHDDKVVVRFTNSGTNIGSFLNQPPTANTPNGSASASTPSATAASPKPGSPKTSSTCCSNSRPSPCPSDRPRFA
jgi:limonene-1,2-epoxide hydrolase